MREFVRFLLLAPEGQLVVGFMLREMTQPSDALDTIYEGLLEGVHRRACALWGAATGQPAESEAVRLAVFGTIGQILYFRVARPVVTKRMGWPAIGAAEAGAIGNAIVRTLHARLAADRGERR